MSDIKMRGPKGCADTLSHAGETFTADKKGVFTVPVSAHEFLILHGFVAVGDQPSEVTVEAAL